MEVWPIEMNCLIVMGAEMNNKSQKANAGYHCDSCEYDLCVDCFNQLDIKETAEVKCDKQHRLTKTYDLQTAGSAYPDQTYSCDICSTLGNAMQEGVYHCYSCGCYDMCPKCMENIGKGTDPTHSKLRYLKLKCSKGHLMGKVYQLSIATIDPSSKYLQDCYVCSKCSSPQSSLENGCYHCDICKFDICPHCASKH